MASWFYLTLWRGSPPEMTDYRDVVIDTGDAQSAEIIQRTAHSGVVSLTDSASAMITETDSFGVEVEQRDEVTFFVGLQH